MSMQLQNVGTTGAELCTVRLKGEPIVPNGFTI